MYLTIPHHFLGKLINGLDHPVRLQMWDTHSMRALFSLLIQRGRRVKCYEKPDTKWNHAFPGLCWHLGYSELSWHCTGICHGVRKCRRQTWPLQMREQAAGCCLPLCVKGKLCVPSHPWDALLLSHHSWNFVSIYTGALLSLSLKQNIYHCDSKM